MLPFPFPFPLPFWFGIGVLGLPLLPFGNCGKLPLPIGVDTAELSSSPLFPTA